MNPVFIDVSGPGIALKFTYNAGNPAHRDSHTVAVLKALGADKVYCPTISGKTYHEQLQAVCPGAYFDDYVTYQYRP